MESFGEQDKDGHIVDVQPSVLGMIEYWDSSYDRELKEYKDIGDYGQVWFGEGTMKKVVNWVSSCPEVTPDSPILDVGCGNGISLVELAKRGYTKLTGVDYCASAVRLAAHIAKEEQLDITYQTLDLLNSDDVSNLGFERFSVVLDKGTFDAVSLSPDDSQQKRKVYSEMISRLLDPDSARLFVISSCNWTNAELKVHFEKEFDFVEEIPSPKFNFGGKSGSTVSNAIFKKKL